MCATQFSVATFDLFGLLLNQVGSVKKLKNVSNYAALTNNLSKTPLIDEPSQGALKKMKDWPKDDCTKLVNMCFFVCAPIFIIAVIVAIVLTLILTR